MEIQIKKILLLVGEISEKQEQIDYLDVIVELENDHKYVASFFTFDYVNRLCYESKGNGEFLNGQFFWAKNMLLIQECSSVKIQEVVEFLMEEGDFFDVFRKI